VAAFRTSDALAAVVGALAGPALVAAAGLEPAMLAFAAVVPVAAVVLACFGRFRSSDRLEKNFAVQPIGNRR
jgi:hypothetical protein